MYRIVYVQKDFDIEYPIYIPGDLDYCLTSCKLDLECGKAGTLTIGVPDYNPATYPVVSEASFTPALTDEAETDYTYTDLYDYTIEADLVNPTNEVIVYRDDKEIWRGRPITEARDFYNTGTLTCEGILSYLYDTYFPPFEFEGSPKEFLQMVLDYHNSLVEERKQFELGEITVVDNNDYINRSSIYYDRCLTVLTEKLINDTLGGYFRVRIEDGHRYLDYLENYNTQASQAVEFGENLLDIAQDIEYTDTASVILPLGARLEDEDGMQTDEYTTIESVNNGSIYYIDDEALAQYGWICVSNEWEDVTLPENLLEKAKDYLAQCTNAVSSMSVNAVDLSAISEDVEPINLGDYVLIRSDPHGINQYVELTAMTIYPLNPENDVLNFGGETASLTSSQRSSSRSVESALSSLSMRVTNLTANVINAVYANIETIVAGMITTDVIRAAVADLGYVTADYLNAFYLTAAEIEANYLSADSAVITDLTAFQANITSLLAGEAGVGELQTIHLTADNVVIDDLVAESILSSNALIATLIAGNIYTDYIKIANNEGENLLIDGATIQINDGTVIRVQIGLDGEGNYNFYLFNSYGEAIWDALGLTEAGLIGNGAIIRDVAVADDANISGYKLNIEEVGSYLNESGYTLEATQVTIDGETLDYKLTQMTEQIEGINFDGLLYFDTYFCLWWSAEEKPVEEDDFIPAYTDEAETDYSYTDLYDYSELWSIDEPSQEDGAYMWLRYLCYYNDGHTEWSDCYCITDDFVRKQTTVLQTQLEVVQGQISARIWMSDIAESIDTAVTDIWGEVNIWIDEIEMQVGNMSSTMDSLSAQVATQDITINSITDTVYQIESQISSLEGIDDFAVYFCEWGSAIDAPVEEADFIPAYTDEAETDYSYTDLYDYADLWSEDVPKGSEAYIWVKYYLVYQDGSTEWKNPYCISDYYARQQANYALSEVSVAYTQIEQLTDSITLTVANINQEIGTLGTSITENTAQIELLSDSITSTVTYFEDEIGLVETSLRSEIEQLAGSISLKVEGGVGSLAQITMTVGEQETQAALDLSKNIRQAFADDDESAITISAGTIAFNANTFTCDSDNFVVEEDGTLFAISPYFTWDIYIAAGNYINPDKSDYAMVIMAVSDMIHWGTSSTETSTFWAGENYNLWTYYMTFGYAVETPDTNSAAIWGGLSIDNGGLMVLGRTAYFYNGLTCIGTKSRAVYTDDYDVIDLYAFESPSPMFSDMGSGIIGEDGETTVFFDPEFSETIDMNCEYQVMLTKTSEKDVDYADKQNGYFTVHGEAGAMFDWMVMAHQRDYTLTRNEQEDLPEPDIAFDDSIFADDDKAECEVADMINVFERQVALA